MPIRVQITNQDNRETAVISVTNSNSGVSVKLKGGETAEFYIYTDNDLHIEEVSD